MRHHCLKNCQALNGILCDSAYHITAHITCIAAYSFVQNMSASLNLRSRNTEKLTEVLMHWKNMLCHQEKPIGKLRHKNNFSSNRNMTQAMHK
jgi:hypothetical protein